MRKGATFVAGLAALLLVLALNPAGAGAQATQQVGVIEDDPVDIWNWSDEELAAETGDTISWCFDPAGGPNPPCRPINAVHDVVIYTPEYPDGELVADSGDFLPAPDPPAFEYTFTEAGTYNFICSYHSSQMNGVVEVTDGGGGDVTAPVTTAALDPPEPGPGGTYTGPVEVTLTATDEAGGSGVESTEYAIDGGAFQPYDAPFTVSAEGVHTIQYRSTDVAGNAEANKQVGFTIDPDGGGDDETAPVTTAALDPPEPGPGGTYTGPVEVTLTATDEAGGSGVASTEYAIDGGEPQAYDAPFTVPDEGAHTIAYHSADVAGNIETEKQVQFTIDPGGGGDAELTTSVRPRTKRVKPHRKAAFTVGVENVGGAAANEVKVCAKAPRRLVKVTDGRCWTRLSVAPDASPSSRFMFKPKRRARGKRVRIQFVTTSENGGGGKYKATLKVARR